MGNDVCIHMGYIRESRVPKSTWSVLISPRDSNMINKYIPCRTTLGLTGISFFSSTIRYQCRDIPARKFSDTKQQQRKRRRRRRRRRSRSRSKKRKEKEKERRKKSPGRWSRRLTSNCSSQDGPIVVCKREREMLVDVRVARKFTWTWTSLPLSLSPLGAYSPSTHHRRDTWQSDRPALLKTEKWVNYSLSPGVHILRGY